jgi:hypothetical protein
VALFPLNVITEILINGTWRDISRFVYERDTMTITGGATARGETAQPAAVNITLDNRDGRFSPNYASGVYYPYLQRNTQIRISVNDTSSSGNTYNGFRFWGEVSAWPPLSDISGHDVYVQITASGPLRRIAKGGGEGSALTRYYASLTGLYAPIAYWPCEEDPGVADPVGDQIGTGLQGGSNMTIVSGVPVFKSVSAFNGSDPIGVLNGSTWTGITSAFGTSGDDQFLAPGTYPWIATTTTVDARVWSGGGGGTKGSEGNGGGTGGGGSACVRNASVAVTPGQQYFVTVGAGGAPGNWNAGGSAGAFSTFSGDSVTLAPNPGGGGGANGTPGGSGGAAGTFAGGTGGNDSGSFNQGAGGGGAAGISGNGGTGGNSAVNTAGAGGLAGSGGGGAGANGGAANQDGFDGHSPGGGGGGGWASNAGHTFGGAGGPGKVELVYTASGGGTQPSNNVFRFILFVPKHGAKNAAVLARCVTSGTIAHMDVQYRTGGQIRLLGYSGVGATLFDSGNLAVTADNQTLMVSAELAVSGANVAWAFSAIIPGAQGVVNKTSGTVTTATMGSVSQVIVAPNADITKIAMGHFSVQYALVPLYKVSQALNGHDTEAGIDRFIRLATEQALGAVTEFNETVDHWGFETGTQSWTAANGSLTQSSVTHVTAGQQDWPPVGGTHSLLLTASGAGSPSATAPSGLSGQPCVAGDVVSTSIDLYAPVQLPNAYIGLKWYNAAGTLLSESDTTDVILPAGQPTVFRLVGNAAIAPTSAAFCVPTFGDHHTDAVNTLLYADNVRLAPHMGPQTSKQYKAFLEEIKDLDQGMIKESKVLFGLAMRTRIKLINQSPAITLDYSQKVLSPPLAPVLDDFNVKNDITVKRHKGSKVQVTLQNGQMSILEPPQGTGRYKKTLTAIAAADEQLAALAEHLLLLGTSGDGSTANTERYPTVTVNLARANIAGNPVAPLMSAVAGIEIGDVIQINNLPFWYPSTTTKQMVVGYTETLNAFEWTITWNCIAYSPYIIVTSNLRRW